MLIDAMFCCGQQNIAAPGLFRRGLPVARQRDGSWFGEGAVGGGQQIAVRIPAREPGGLDQRVEERRDLGSALGARPLMVFAPENDILAILPISGPRPSSTTRGIPGMESSASSSTLNSGPGAQ